jgi:hypothetical protein
MDGFSQQESTALSVARSVIAGSHSYAKQNSSASQYSTPAKPPLPHAKHTKKENTLQLLLKERLQFANA